jgi:hypothetical protein
VTVDEYRPGGLGRIWLAAAGFVILMLIMSGGHGRSGTNPTNATNSRTGTLSGNQVEVMSRNQLNLWSDVQNCYGDYSCMTIISTTTSTVENTSTTVDNARNTTTINGDRNVVIGSDGARLCEDPQTHIFTTAACQ